MYLPTPPAEGDFTPPPHGAWPAYCYRLIDLGTQKSEYNGEAKINHKILLSWEIADNEERMNDGRPWIISKRYNWSMHEKSGLRIDLESWRGMKFQPSDFGQGGFDLRKILGQKCLLSIVHTTKNDKTYANISSISKPPKSMAFADAINPPVYLWINQERFDRNVFGQLPDKIQETIKASPEYQALQRGGMQSGEPIYDETYIGPSEEDMNDPIPF